MGVAAMNHFTVLSDDLEATRRFYCDLFGFKVGWRPPFQFPGWWLYADDDTPILHVIHRDPLPKERAGVLDHMAFSAKDLPGTVTTLQREGIEYEASGSCSSMIRTAPRSSSTSTRMSRRRRATSAPDPSTLTHQPLRAGPPSPALRERGFAVAHRAVPRPALRPLGARVRAPVGWRIAMRQGCRPPDRSPGGGPGAVRLLSAPQEAGKGPGGA